MSRDFARFMSDARKNHERFINHKKTLLQLHVQFMNDFDFLVSSISDPIFMNEYFMNEYHIKGNRPAAPNPREDIHGNLFDYEEFMNSL